MAQFDDEPPLTISAMTGQGLEKLISEIVMNLE